MILRLVVISVFVGIVLGGKWQPKKKWCYKITKSYQRTVKIPEQVCRFVPGISRIPPFPSRSNVSIPADTPQTPSRNSLRDDKVTAKEVMKLFPGLFLDKKTVTKLNTKLKKEGKRPIKPELRPEVNRGILPGFRPSGSNDGDIHCPTFRELVQAPDAMQNINKQSRDIVHFASEGVYQYVHKGVCGSSSSQSCNGGGCLQEKSIVYLMVWKDNPDWPTAFEAFEVKSYCSCKNITP